MTALTALSTLVFLAAVGPALLYLRNRTLYRPPPENNPRLPAVSVLIPARNEERSIADAVKAVLASRGVELEVIVLDDHSEDATARIVADLAQTDLRVRLESAPPLPEGWCGKQHACTVLASLARHPLLVFVDADVRLHPNGLARLTAFLETSRADLISGIPCQETGTLLEKLVIPLIHFLLLGFLPMGPMRRYRWSAFGAGCGQMFVTRANAYARMGTHAVIRTSLHDGVTLPRAYRRAGLMTDLCDATETAVCRMYRSAGELWRGLVKNAGEGLAAPGMIGPATLLLLLGQVAPLPVFATALALGDEAAIWLAGTAVIASFAPRLDAVVRFRQSLLGAVLHPIGVIVVVLIQWESLLRRLLHRPVGWKGRPHPLDRTLVQVPQ